MSNNVKRTQALNKYFRRTLGTKLPRHFETFTAFINGVIEKGHVSMTKIAKTMPNGNKVDSNETKLRRFVQCNNVDAERYYMPFIRKFLHGLCFDLLGNRNTIAIAFDITGIGKNTSVLMASVIYKRRSIPIVWITLPQGKGHTTQENHLLLLDFVNALLPDDASVVILGDGEYDGTRFQESIVGSGWDYVVRTSLNLKITHDGEYFEARDTDMVGDDPIWQICDIEITTQLFSLSTGNLSLVGWHERHWHTDIYLLTNLELAGEAVYWYRKRFRIETFFSDQKSRGFRIDKTHLTDASRIHRLLIVCCFAYLWISLLGVLAQEKGMQDRLARKTREDLSIFQLGFALLDYYLNYEKTIEIITNTLELNDLCKI